jgi:hypothetical protein
MRLLICKCFICLFWALSLQADWNADHDITSKELIESLPAFYAGEYKQARHLFMQIREVLLRDGLLKRQIKETAAENRLILLRPREGVVIKKRAGSYIHELFAWEVSLLFGSSSCVVPSFPVEISGKRVILQQMEPFHFGKGENERPSPSAIKKVCLHDYWKAHLQAYLLGLGDLLGRNIGIDPDGKIRFFDTEATFRYQNQPRLDNGLVAVGFIMESFDWPQYRMPLDRKSVELIRRFIKELQDFEERLSIYENIRPVSILREDLLVRLEKIRNFPLEEGRSFRDFFGYIYPDLDDGLDELNHIVSHIIGSRVDHGASLFFVSQRMRRYQLSSESKRLLDEWMAKYIKGFS